MERLWAPWRMEYIRSTVKEPADTGCVFCAMLNEQDDVKNLILHRFPRCFLVLNLYPYTNGHLMVVPLRHTAEFASITPEEHTEMGDVLALAQKVIAECFTPHGFNIGMNLGRSAGAGVVGHLHYHIVPRWSGDSNFMSTVGHTRVMSESLPESYARLKIAIDKQLASA